MTPLFRLNCKQSAGKPGYYGESWRPNNKKSLIVYMNKRRTSPVVTDAGTGSLSQCDRFMSRVESKGARNWPQSAKLPLQSPVI